MNTKNLTSNKPNNFFPLEFFFTYLMIQANVKKIRNIFFPFIITIGLHKVFDFAASLALLVNILGEIAYM